MAGTPFFWEDGTQASERITNTYILFGDQPAFVDAVGGPSAEPTAVIHTYPDGAAHSVLLSDERFHRFRRLPPIGWVNWGSKKVGAYLERRPVRSRQHGLSDQNVSVGMVSSDYRVTFREEHYGSIARDAFYAAACKDEYPLLDQILPVIRPSSTIAFDHSYAVYCDPGGLKWMYRHSERVGLFSGTDTMLLLGSHSYLREELAESKAITIANIREF